MPSTTQTTQPDLTKLTPEQRENYAEPLIQLVRQNLKSRRYHIADDYLELLYVAAPQSRKAMELRAELATAQGNHIKADALKEIASCL